MGAIIQRLQYVQNVGDWSKPNPDAEEDPHKADM